MDEDIWMFEIHEEGVWHDFAIIERENHLVFPYFSAHGSVYPVTNN